MPSHLLRRALKRGFLFLFPARVIGSSHIPKQGPVIVAGNHISPLDGVYVWASLRRRNIFFLATSSLFLRPLVRIAMEWSGQIAVNEKDRFSSQPDSGASALRAAQDVLVKYEGVIGIHPEGQCSDDGEMGKFFLGVVRLAFATGAPVVPVGIRGSQHVLAELDACPRLFLGVTLIYGEPISVKGLANTIENRQWLRATLRESIVKLLS